MTGDDPQKWFQGFWAATSRSIFQEINEGKERGRFGLDDAAYRLFVVNERTHDSAVNYLKEKGWDDEFGPLMSLIVRNNLREAIETPRGSPLPEAQEPLGTP